MGPDNKPGNKIVPQTLDGQLLTMDKKGNNVLGTNSNCSIPIPSCKIYKNCLKFLILAAVEQSSDITDVAQCII